MKKTILTLSLLLAANAFSARLDIQPRTALEPVASARKAKVLRQARASITLDDGSQWIIHRVPAQHEPGAFGVTRFGADGSARVFLVSDWLPKGSIPRGLCGQVRGVTQLTDGRVAVSAAWTDGVTSHNAIFVLRVREDGRYDTERVIEVPGVSHIAAGPRSSIVAVTNDASRHGGGPMATVFDAQGRVLGAYFDQDSLLSPPAAAQNALQARLQRVGENGFALYDPQGDLIRVFELDVSARDVTLTPQANIFVGDDASTADLQVLGIEPTADGDIVVARVGLVRGNPTTQLTVYDRLGGVKESATLDRPWNLMLRENGRIQGLVLRGDASLDTVALRREQ
jgi:hypothetical protein